MKMFKYCFYLIIFVSFLGTSVFAGSSQLDKEIRTIEKLLEDGVLSQEDFEKVKKNLIEKDKKRQAKLKSKKKSTEKISSDLLNLEVLFKDSPKSSDTWEPARFFYGDYEVYTFRPGGIKVKRISDNKVLATITDRLKIKYSNNGRQYIRAEIEGTERPDAQKELEFRKKEIEKLTKSTKEFVLNPAEKLKQLSNKIKTFSKTLDVEDLKVKGNIESLIPKDSIKFDLYIEDVKLLKVDGRYVNKHRAFFYQFITTNYQPFHYYVVLQGRPPIAFNIVKFTRNVDRAVRKAKERLAVEHNITLEQIDKIIEKRIDDEIDQAATQAIDQAVSDSVAQAIEESVGAAMAKGLVDAIEAATGQAIDDALEAELGAAIDAEIARAVEMGIDEAAVTAGWQAYFDTIAAGGSEAEAVAAAYDACGGPCEGY
jgi:hypothetical protein